MTQLEMFHAATEYVTPKYNSDSQNYQVAYDAFKDGLQKGFESGKAEGFESRQGEWVSVNERPPSSTTLLCAYTNAMGSAHMGYFVGFFSEGGYYEQETENRWKGALFPIYAWQRVQLPKSHQPLTATNS
jgi:hypothetical protein